MEQNETNVTFDPTVVYAQIVKRDDGYHVIDFDGTEGPVCNKRTSDGYVILSPNKANRKCYNEKNLAKQFAEGAESVPLYYRETRKIVNKTSMPNAKLIAYLPEEYQAEYKAIIDRAIAARDAEKAAAKKPKLTEAEKLEAKIAKLKAKLAELNEEGVN